MVKESYRGFSPFQWALSFQGFQGLVDLSHFSFNTCVCVCMHMCVCVCMYMYMCRFMWRSEVDVQYLPTISNFHLIFWGSVSHWVRVLSQELSGTSLSAQWGLGSAFLHLFPSPSAGLQFSVAIFGFSLYLLWEANISPDRAIFIVPHSFLISCVGFWHFASELHSFAQWFPLYPQRAFGMQRKHFELL